MPKNTKEPIGTYVTEIYCQDPSCNVRNCTVVTKKLDRTPEPKEWHCPACGQLASVHWRKTVREYDTKMNQEALGRVNGMLYQRDNGGLGFPVHVICLSELPADWKAVDPLEAKAD